MDIAKTAREISDERHWFVLYTRSRTEKRVADELAKAGIEVYCPVIRTRRKWSDRVKTVEEPLFRCYCFVRLAEKERPHVFAVPGIVRYLFWLNKPAVVREEEIQAIRDLLQKHDHRQISVGSFKAEEAVRLRSGAFAGHDGTVKEQRGAKIYLYLDSLQTMITVDLNTTSVERA